MKINTLKLKAALENLRPILKGRNTIPVLSCVRLSAKDGKLEIMGSNLDEYALEEVECDGDLSPICASAQYLLNSIGGEQSEITLESGGLSVSCEFGESKLPTMDAEEFPALPDMAKAEKHGVSCGELAAAIRLVDWAASDDPGRYILNSVFVSSKAKKLTVVSTNGRELASVEPSIIGSDFEVVIPSAFAANLAAFLKRDGAVASSSASWICVGHESGSYFCKQLEGNYPNYKQVIPAKKIKLGSVALAEIKSLVTRCLCFTEQKEANTKFAFTKTGLTVEFVGDKNARISHHMPGKFSPFEINLNARSICKALSNIKAEEINLYHSGDNLSPIQIEAGELLVLSMPFRPK